MSPHSRAWSWLAALLAVALLGVLALGGWAQWRPVSADDAARLAALGTASRLRGTPAAAGVVGTATLDEQITVLGPEATPSRTRHLAAASDDAAPGGGELPAAVAAVIEDAHAAEDPALAATLGGVAASWSAARARQDPGSDPVTSAEPAAPGSLPPSAAESGAVTEPASARAASPAPPEEPTADATAQRCRPGTTAAVTELDRTLYVLNAVAARDPVPTAAQHTALESLRGDGARLLDSPTVAPLLRCTPYPAKGAYALPDGIVSDPVAAAAEAAGDLVQVSAASLAHADAAEREWLLAALERGARARAVLAPDEPLPAVAGRGA